METAGIFVIVAFCLGAVLVLSKDNIPPKLKKWLALWAIFAILVAFGIIVYYLFSLGS